ncbi:hypothetical protein ACET3Z_025369 [Daucus carota]
MLCPAYLPQHSTNIKSKTEAAESQLGIRVLQIFLLLLTLIHTGASTRPGKEPLEDSVQVLSKLSPVKPEDGSIQANCP